MGMEVSEPRPILIVDDDLSFREALESLVQSFGYKTHSFAGAALVLTSGLARVAACLIVDVQMPDMDGLALQSRLTDAGAARPIIFMTARPDPRVRTRALEAGALEVLTKPCDRDVLFSLIQAACAL